MLANWNAGLAALAPVVEPELGVPASSTPYGSSFAPEDHVPIPRNDLPFGTPDWHGVGTHATRVKKANGDADPKRIVWRAP